MSNYYFIGTLLPEVQIGMPPEISVSDFLMLLNQNLNKKDLQQVFALRRYFDIENLRAFWTKQKIDHWGNYDENTLEEALLTQVGFPEYVYDFIEKNETVDKKLRHFAALQAEFFKLEIHNHTGFIGKLFTLERKIQLILTALRAKKMGRNYLQEFQYEDGEDPLVQLIISQKDVKDFDPPDEFEDLKELFVANQLNPLALHRAILEYRFKKINELIGLQVFTIDRILAYMFQLILAEKWIMLDQVKGHNIINSMVQGVA